MIGMDGILNINKSTGMTSHDVVAQVRKLLGQRRVGHAGTLDPQASGVLPICVGQATRVAEYLSESGKAYRATVCFGVETDTYDVEGTVTHTASTVTLSRAHIESLLPAFLGEQMQVPPRYSAIKVQGQPAHKRARAGEELTLEARRITISRLEISDWLPPELILDIECSKGTYIRSLAYDLGQRSGYGAHLSALVRTRSGPFHLVDSIEIAQLAEAASQGTIARYLHPADVALAQYPALTLDDETVVHVLHGNAFGGPGEVVTRLARVYDGDKRFLAIAEWDEAKRVWQPVKVFGA